MIINKIKNNEGAALISVIFALLIILILLNAIVSITVTESRISVNDKDAVQALYLAEGGTELAVNYLYNNPQFRGEMLAEYIDFSNGSLTGIVLEDADNQVKITSTASVNEIKKKYQYMSR